MFTENKKILTNFVPKLIPKIKIDDVEIWSFQDSLKYYTTIDAVYFVEEENIEFSGRYSKSLIIRDSLISDYKEMEDNLLIIDKFLAKVKESQSVFCKIEIETLAQSIKDCKLVSIDKKIANYSLRNIIIDEINVSYKATFVKEKF